jgi:hypothetical protein
MDPGPEPSHFPRPALVLFFLSLVAALAAGFFLGLREIVRAFSWTAANQWALASGALAFFVVLAPLAELDTSRADDPWGDDQRGLLHGRAAAGRVPVGEAGNVRGSACGYDIPV